jgi:16S rRNA (cytosine967-C5)-methyltransferase
VKATLAHALRDGARIVARIAQGKSLAEELAREPANDEAPRAALIDITHGTLRRYGRVQFIVAALSHRPGSDALVEALLWCSIYALESGRYSDYTVVDQAVRACTLLEKWNAKGYVNALLRSYSRQRAGLESRIAAEPAARFQHPPWWIERLERAYPQAAATILDAGNSHPPMSVRVNVRRTTAEAYRAALADEGIAARLLGSDALLLERPVPVARLPGFQDGLVSVQDAGAQCAAHYLDLAGGQRVLDACAAPGGKAGHILERAEVALTALDADVERLQRMRSNLDRLKLQATLKAADCTRLESWWDGQPFARVLADVPCSASGIVRRHPDLKWLRRPSDLAAFAQRQAAILDALWRALERGGKLLYVTCSVFPEENDEVVDGFLARTQGARRLPLPDGSAAQRLPDAERDGFFYALIAKQV